MDVTIRSRREHCPSGQQATGPERLEKVLKLAHGDGVLAAVEMSGLVELEGLSIVPLGGPVPNASILIVELRNAAAVEQFVDIDTVLRSADDGALGHRAEFIGPVPAGGRGIGRTYAVLGPDVKEIAVFTRAEPSGVLEDAAALQVLEPAIRLPNGRHLQGRVELHGQLRLDSFSAAYERDARPDEYQVSIEVGNSTAIDQLVSVHLLLRSSDGTPVDFEEHLIDSVAATGRGLARCGATIGPDIRQIDVLVRAVPEAIPGAEGVVVTAGQDAEASHKQDHLAVACKVVERQVRLADGRSLPAKAELQGRVRLDGISVVQERNPRPDEYQVLTEVVNTADTEQYFDVGILLRSADGDTVGYEDSFIDRVAPGARGIGRAWAMVGPQVTQIEMTVKATS